MIDPALDSYFDDYKNVLHNRSHPLTVNSVFMNLYDNDWLHWEKDTITNTLTSDFVDLDVDQPFRDVIWSLIILHTSPRFESDLDAFENIVDAFNYNYVDFGTRTLPSPAEVHHALKTAEILFNNNNDKQEYNFFDDEIKKYIASLCYHRGLVVLPKPLNVSDKYLEMLLKNNQGKKVRGNVLKILQKEEFKSPDENTPEYIQIMKYFVILTYTNDRLNEHKFDLMTIK